VVDFISFTNLINIFEGRLHLNRSMANIWQRLAATGPLEFGSAQVKRKLTEEIGKKVN
jgi:hypothetical protein